MRKFDLVTGAFLVLMSLVVFSVSLKMLLTTVNNGRDWYVSAGLFPAVIAAVLFGLSTQLIFIALRDGALEDLAKSSLFKALMSRGFRALMAVVVLTLIYVISLKHISYIVATTIYLFILLLAGTKKFSRSLIVSLVGAWVIALTFERLANIPLP